MKQHTIPCELSLQIEMKCSSQAIQKVILAPGKEPGILLLLTSPPFEQKILDWLHAYSIKKPIPLDLPFGFDPMPPFTASIYESIKAIPFGEIAAYGEISARAPRAVGRVCHFNPFPLFYPCHRVVRKGALGGFAYGSPLKKALLDFEA